MRWPNVLAAGLGGKARVIEEGHNGRTTVFDDPHLRSTTATAPKALPMLLSTHQPLDLVIIMLGTNDIKYRQPLPRLRCVDGHDAAGRDRADLRLPAGLSRRRRS